MQCLKIIYKLNKNTITIQIFFFKIRTVGFVIINVAICLASFAAVKLFPIMLEIIDLHGCMFTLGIGCIIASIFVYFFLKETSNQSIDDVGAEDKIETIPNSRC